MLGGLKLRLVAALALALFVMGLLLRNRQLRDKADELDGFKQTRLRADRADISAGDANADGEWLLNRSAGSGSRSDGDQPAFRRARRGIGDGKPRSGYGDW